FGTTFTLPASPPVPPSGWNAAGIEPSSRNLNDGVIRCTAMATCGDASRDIPAGFDHTVLASSPAAAPPANALPIALPEFSCNAKPAPNACPAESAIAKLLTATATFVRLTRAEFIVAFPRVKRRESSDRAVHRMRRTDYTARALCGHRSRPAKRVGEIGVWRG